MRADTSPPDPDQMPSTDRKRSPRGVRWNVQLVLLLFAVCFLAVLVVLALVQIPSGS
jgi:Flp pilus assembly protein TadB